MVEKKLQSASQKKIINDTIVHIVLTILAVIWLFPIFWVIMTSFRKEQGSYISTFIPAAFTTENYERLFTDTTILNFSQMFGYCNMFMYFIYILCTCSILLSVKNKI